MKRKVILSIDSHQLNKLSVGLQVGAKKVFINRKVSLWTSQLLLPLINELLRKNHLVVTDLSEIKVSCGPGSYTGLRVGIAIAQAMAFLLEIPLNGQKNRPVELIYENDRFRG